MSHWGYFPSLLALGHNRKSKEISPKGNPVFTLLSSLEDLPKTQFRFSPNWHTERVKLPSEDTDGYKTAFTLCDLESLAYSQRFQIVAKHVAHLGAIIFKGTPNSVWLCRNCHAQNTHLNITLSSSPKKVREFILHDKWSERGPFKWIGGPMHDKRNHGKIVHTKSWYVNGAKSFIHSNLPTLSKKVAVATL